MPSSSRLPSECYPGAHMFPGAVAAEYQHASPGFQLQMKMDILKETFSRARLPLPSGIGSVAGPPWRYRNRIRLHVMGAALGYRQPEFAQSPAGNPLPHRRSSS